MRKDAYYLAGYDKLGYPVYYYKPLFFFLKRKRYDP